MAQYATMLTDRFLFTRRSWVAVGAALAACDGRVAAAADWESTPPEALAPRAARLDDALAAGAKVPGLRALLVAHRGQLLAERYYAGAQADALLPMFSATKSVCALLVGLALADGSLKSLDDTVAQLLPEALADVPDSPAGPVTLRQILSGRTGLVFDPAAFGRIAGADSLTRQVLNEPGRRLTPPGWSYNDAMVSLLAPILSRAQGQRLSALASRGLWAPLGIDRHDWRRDRQGNPLAAAGLALRPRDLLKLAVLMLDRGQWQGRPVLPPDWVEACLTPQGPASWTAGPVQDVGYGLLWFTGRLHGQPVAWAWGYGGQFALLVPGLKLAVATAAAAPHPAALRAQTDAVMALVGRMVEAAV